LSKGGISPGDAAYQSQAKFSGRVAAVWFLIFPFWGGIFSIPEVVIPTLFRNMDPHV